MARSIHFTAPSWLGTLPGRFTRNNTSLVFARQTTRGWYPQIPLYDRAMPCLRSPRVVARVPSMSMRASLSSPLARFFQIRVRTRLMQSINVSISDGRKRRVKSPAVAGSGRR